jgi:hypothetical protein
MKQLNFICSHDAVIGYHNSNIAKGEKNDCVVKAFAVAFEVHYDVAHKKVSEIFGRQPQGATFKFAATLKLFSKERKQINQRRVKTLSDPFYRMMYWVNEGKPSTQLRNMTTVNFIKQYPVGTYIVEVKEHTFVIKNGTVIGNPEDAIQRKKVVYNAWQIL